MKRNESANKITAANAGGHCRLPIRASWAARIAEFCVRMKATARILVFGVLSGLLWSAIPGVLTELFRSVGEALTVAVAGCVTGVIVSVALSRPLMFFGRPAAILLGVVSLPIGAFTFGAVLSIVQRTVLNLSGISYRFAAPDFAPFTSGFQYAIGSVLSVFALGLFPLAVVTTVLLRVVIRIERQNETGS